MKIYESVHNCRILIPVNKQMTFSLALPKHCNRRQVFFFGIVLQAQTNRATSPELKILAAYTGTVRVRYDLITGSFFSVFRTTHIFIGMAFRTPCMCQ